MTKLNMKTALVTGAFMGIGAGIALELAAAGACVVVYYASDTRGAEVIVYSINESRGHSSDRWPLTFSI